MRSIRPFAALLLSAIIAVTGLGLAAARGQAMSGGQVVLCSGGRSVTVTIGPDGMPAGPAHICPDMALGLLLAVALPDAVPVPDASFATAAASVMSDPATGTEPPVAIARGPPALT